ncbi:hypothetical protein Tco_1428612 [Tanacetum coccineum]
MEVDSDDEMDGPELIFPYEEMGLPNATPPDSDTSSNFESETAPAATICIVTQMPATRRRFPRSTYVMGGPSSATPVAYHPEELVSSTLNREGRRRLDLLDFYLGIVERNDDKVEHKVVTLEDRILELEQDGVREEYKRLRKKLESTKVSVTLARMDQDQVERDLYHFWAWAYRFYEDMIRSGAVEERPGEVIDVLAVLGETQPPEPQGSPCDSQLIMPPKRMTQEAIERLITNRVAAALAQDCVNRENTGGPTGEA